MFMFTIFLWKRWRQPKEQQVIPAQDWDDPGSMMEWMEYEGEGECSTDCFDNGGRLHNANRKWLGKRTKDGYECQT